MSSPPQNFLNRCSREFLKFLTRLRKAVHLKISRLRLHLFESIRPLAVAAAILIAATGVFFAVLNNLSTRPQAVPDSIAKQPSTESFVPLHAENVFEGVEDDGLFLTGGKIPVHGVRYRFSDSFHWQNPKDGSVIKMTVPSEAPLPYTGPNRLIYNPSHCSRKS